MFLGVFILFSFLVSASLTSKTKYFFSQSLFSLTTKTKTQQLKTNYYFCRSLFCQQLTSMIEQIIGLLRQKKYEGMRKGVRCFFFSFFFFFLLSYTWLSKSNGIYTIKLRGSVSQFLFLFPFFFLYFFLSLVVRLVIIKTHRHYYFQSMTVTIMLTSHLYLVLLRN